MLLTSDLQAFKAELGDPETRQLRVESQIRVGIPIQIRAMREMRGWTQGELAEKIGTTQNTISRLESPRSNTPNVSTLERLANAFDVALLVRFAPFSDYHDFSRRMSKNSVAVPPFDEELAELQRDAENASHSIAEYMPMPDELTPAPFAGRGDVSPAGGDDPVLAWNSIAEAMSHPEMPFYQNAFDPTRDAGNSLTGTFLSMNEIPESAGSDIAALISPKSDKASDKYRGLRLVSKPAGTATNPMPTGLKRPA